MIVLATLMTFINGVSGTPYISGGDSPSGTDCSGLASWVSNVATGRDPYGDRFNTGNMRGELQERGFRDGTAPGALVIGWNSGHAAVTLPDGTPVSSGETGGVAIGGEGAYQPQFTNHMYLPMSVEDQPVVDPAAPAPLDPMAAPAPLDVAALNAAPPPPPGPEFVPLSFEPNPPAPEAIPAAPEPAPGAPAPGQSDPAPIPPVV